MKVTGISFGSNFKLKVGDVNGTTNQQINNEIDFANQARKVGVFAPKYDVSSNAEVLTYQTKGEIANYHSNPIERKHFAKLFNNIYLLDTLNISHNDLEMTHCFYSQDGDVEFDCFRFGNYFKKGEINLPEFEMPNNLTNYENTSLAFYVDEIPNRQCKIEFLKNYLKGRSLYHEKRAEYIQNNLNKISKFGVVLTEEMLKTEQIRAQMCKNPNDDMASLLLKKLEFGKRQRIAFTLWDEGNGACGHEFSKEKRMESIPKYLNSIKVGIECVKEAEKLSAQCINETEKEYYELEAKTAKYFVDTYLCWVSGMADYNFNDTRVCPKSDEIREKLRNSYNQIFEVDYSSKIKLIDDYIELYLKEISL